MMTEQLATPPPEGDDKPRENAAMLTPEELSERQEATADIVGFADMFLADGIYDSKCNLRMWRYQNAKLGRWQIMHVVETDHYMIERYSRTGKLQAYCIDGNRLDLWGIEKDKDFKQSPAFVSTQRIKEVRGLFRNIQKDLSEEETEQYS